jgi:hypothetical protein
VRTDSELKDPLVPRSGEPEPSYEPSTVWSTLFLIALVAVVVAFLIWRIDANPVR